MKPVFKIAGRLVLAAAALTSACARAPQTATPTAADGGDAQRLVALVDYVGSDYAVARSQDGVVVSRAEYEEQLRFVRDARAMAAALLGPEAAAEPLTRALDRLATLVDAKAPARGGGRGLPRGARGRRSRASGCARRRRRGRRSPARRRSSSSPARPATERSGDADTERARQLQPQPVSFRTRRGARCCRPTACSTP